MQLIRRPLLARGHQAAKMSFPLQMFYSWPQPCSKPCRSFKQAFLKGNSTEVVRCGFLKGSPLEKHKNPGFPRKVLKTSFLTSRNLATSVRFPLRRTHLATSARSLLRKHYLAISVGLQLRKGVPQVALKNHPILTQCPRIVPGYPSTPKWSHQACQMTSLGTMNPISLCKNAKNLQA